jgi:tetratricopeptide (TPR) repeat protein
MADAQKGRGHVDIARNQKRSAREVLKEAYGHYQNAGGARDAAQALMDLGQLDMLMENFDRARVNYAQVRGMYAKLNDAQGEGTAVRAIGDLESAQGRLQQAQQAYAEARILFQSVGDRLSEADAALQIGLLAVNHDNATAAALLVQAGRLYRAVGAVEWQRKAHGLARRVR